MSFLGNTTNLAFYWITIWIFEILGYTWGVRFIDFFILVSGMVIGSIFSFFIRGYLTKGVVWEPKEKLAPMLATWHEDGHFHMILYETLSERISCFVALMKMRFEDIMKIPIDKRKTISFDEVKRARRILWTLVIIAIFLSLIGAMSCWNVLPPEWTIPVPVPLMPK